MALLKQEIEITSDEMSHKAPILYLLGSLVGWRMVVLKHSIVKAVFARGHNFQVGGSIFERGDNKLRAEDNFSCGILRDYIFLCIY